MFGLPSGIELLIFGAIAVLLFRDRVVGVARPVGKAVGQLKKAKQTVRREMTSAVVDAVNNLAGEDGQQDQPSASSNSAAKSGMDASDHAMEPRTDDVPDHVNSLR